MPKTIDAMINDLMEVKDRNKFISEMGELQSVLLTLRYPFLPSIVDRIKSCPDGEINITFKTYKGTVQSALFHEITKISYKPQEKE